MTKIVIQAEWADAPHLSEEAKAALINAYPIHERDARTRGIPQLGSGAIYPIPESEITVKPFKLPPHFKYSYGMDVGWNRTAAIFSAHDTETDTTYLYSEYYRGQAEPSVHATAIRARGEWIPGVIDPAARGRAQKDGEDLLSMYRGLGLNLILADNGVETGIYDVYQRLSSGKIKVFGDLCPNWLMEYRTYRRDEKGKVVKTNDHLMDATRYDVRSGLAIAQFRPAEDWAITKRRNQHTATHDPFAALATPMGQNASEYDPFRGA